MSDIRQMKWCLFKLPVTKELSGIAFDEANSCTNLRIRHYQAAPVVDGVKIHRINGGRRKEANSRHARLAGLWQWLSKIL